MPSAEIVRWDESNYKCDTIPYLKAAYKARKWAFVSDYARLDIIYRHGGIYLDVDVELIRSLDPLLSANAFCGREPSGEVNTGLVLAAEPGAEVIRILRDKYLQLPFLDARGAFSFPACPIVQTTSLKDLGYDPQNSSIQLVEGLTVFPVDYFCPVDETGCFVPTDDSYCLHYGMSSWYPWGWRMLRCGRRVVSRLFGRKITRLLVQCKRIFLPKYK